MLNRYNDTFLRNGLAVFPTRDWHPTHHISFRERGGPWPPHCVQGTPGTEFSTALKLPPSAVVISKATDPDQDAYSWFLRTDLNNLLHEATIRRVFIGGLTTEYWMLNSTRDALKLGYEVFVLADAIRAVNVQPGDGERGVEEMKERGAKIISVESIGP